MRLTDILKKPYYYVPPCPSCHSSKTGRYVKKPFHSDNYMFEESLKNGEIVEEVDEVPEKNAFCSECGYEWSCYITVVWLNKKELHKQKVLRGIEGLDKAIEEEKEKERKSRPLAERAIRTFFGKR